VPVTRPASRAARVPVTPAAGGRGSAAVAPVTRAAASAVRAPVTPLATSRASGSALRGCRHSSLHATWWLSVVTPEKQIPCQSGFVGDLARELLP